MIKNTQPVEPVLREGTAVRVHSVFETIQGEGPFAGCPALFVRLAGCNLQCPLCDTDYTTELLPYDRDLTLVEYITSRANDFGCTLIVLTGGEPFRQPIEGLVQGLLDNAFVVQIETNGTLFRPLPFEHENLAIVCSPKLHYVNRDLLPHIDAFKYVATAESLYPLDGLPRTALDHPLGLGKLLFRPPLGHEAEVYLQPVDEQDEARNKENLQAVVQSCLRHKWTLCLQLHKLIGVA